MECFRLHLAWIEHQFLSGIRDSRKAGSLWGMMSGVGRVRKSWLAKWLRLRLLYCGFKGVQEEIPSEEASKSGQWHFHQDNAPVHNSILVTDYLTKMGIKTYKLNFLTWLELVLLCIFFLPVLIFTFFSDFFPSSSLLSPKNSLWIVQQDTRSNGYRRWFPKLLRRQSSGGCRFNPHYRRVTLQEYLTLVPDYS